MNSSAEGTANDMDLIELNKFKEALARQVELYRRKVNAHSNVEICVRHFIHPNNYHLGKEMQRIAATAMREVVDLDGMWPACKGELWWDKVLATPQVRPPDLHPAELLVHSARAISLTDCGKWIAGTEHLRGQEGQEIYGNLMVSREYLYQVTCPECRAR